MAEKTAQNPITQQKEKIFRKKTAFIKLSLRRISRQFWQLCRIVLIKIQETFFLNWEKKLFPKTSVFLSNCLSEHVESTFDSFMENFIPNVRKVLLKSPITQRKEKKNWKSLFLQHVSEHVENSSDNLSVEFLPKVRKCLNPIPIKLENFSKQIFLIEVFVSVLRKHFSHFCNKKVQKLRKNFDQNPKEEEELFKEVIGCTSKFSSERLESSSANFEE